MSRKKKIFIISHLCLAFAYLSWLLIQPYVKDVLTKKSEKALYEMVFAREELFQALAQEDQELLRNGYAHPRQHPSFVQEWGELFFVQTSPFALAWLFFSIVICLLLLFRIEGASLTVWLLPFVTVLYGYFLYTAPPSSAPSLFPKEEYVRELYADSAAGLRDQRETLLKGWHRYLVVEWGHETPSEDAALFKNQLEKGLFAFNVARLKWLLAGRGDEVILAGFAPSFSFLRVLFYFMWNFLFAWFLNQTEKAIPFEAASSQS